MIPRRRGFSSSVDGGKSFGRIVADNCGSDNSVAGTADRTIAVLLSAFQKFVEYFRNMDNPWHSPISGPDLVHRK
jgi:hypothetical protein